MANPAFRLHGAGAGVVDLVHGAVDLREARLSRLLSRRSGDGGLVPGGLVFADDLALYAGAPWDELLAELAPGGSPPLFNAGGPGLIASAVAAQLLRPAKLPVTYYGLSGDDPPASRLRWLLAQTPLDLTCFRQRPGSTDCTWVFTDSASGDRFFVTRAGTSQAEPEILGESFFQATLNLYAGTAQLPALHRALPDLLAKSRRRGAFTVVGTVFDFAAERDGRPWSLGGDGAWPDIDLLVANETECLRLGGGGSVEQAVDRMIDRGLMAAVVTRGADPVYFRSIGGIFGECRGEVPVDPALAAKAGDRRAHPGDMTGAGDNFLAALLASFFRQWLADDFYPKGELHLERELHHMNPLKLRSAIGWGVSAGGLACLQYGGLRLEKSRGERLSELRELRQEPDPASLRW